MTHPRAPGSAAGAWESSSIFSDELNGDGSHATADDEPLLDSPERPPNEILAEQEKLYRRWGADFFAIFRLEDRREKMYFLPKKLAEHIMAERPLARGIDGRWWVYDGGVWRAAEPSIIRDRVSQLLGERFEIARATNSEAIIWGDPSLPKITCEATAQYINFRNGLLEWSTGLLLPHDPAVLSTIQLPGDWDPTATCPAFDAFLAQVVPEDVISLVWELIGYMMYDGNPFHKAGMLDGSGRNGKGTFLRNGACRRHRRVVPPVSLVDG
ncbi:MAG TPA: hypothetical protein VGL46_16940 [Pseudonocardiaceae bacterium]|jgi:hypothetical protein